MSVIQDVTHTAHATQGVGVSQNEKALPLPGWLTKLYFLFPVVLYIPDALFNYYVYSDGISRASATPLIQWGFVVLWVFLSVGVVGMAYLLSVLAPWHWGQGHRMQAIFCALGVVIATAITTWNSLAYRSTGFVSFKTDDWVYALWPQLQANHVSVTMILVAVAPPFWGLFWAIVQPTQTGRSLRQLQESHQERLMRLQQEAELKSLRAEANAKIREAQVRGMAQTAAAVRDQAGGLGLFKTRGAPTPPVAPTEDADTWESAEHPALHDGAQDSPDVTSNGDSDTYLAASDLSAPAAPTEIAETSATPARRRATRRAQREQPSHPNSHPLATGDTSHIRTPGHDVARLAR